ncbi:ComF family protein [Isoptericola sp. AK164]|uniref:ComF family protein n=1 Tax=Isoptericola sp. AK164 TaxID=3024246 RepID=UPI0024183333|nr:ComF family protein [Isoptericola sp. AK164]
MLTDLARLVVPVVCPGCGLPDVPWCPGCARAAVGGPARRVEAGAPRLDRLDGAGPLPTWALADYAGAVRDLVVAWKDRGRADLDRLLVPALRRAAGTTAPRLRAAAASRPVAVVPAPSAPGARWRRAREPVRTLADAVADGLAAAGLRARVVPALRRRPSRDQVGLGARARGRNLAASVALRHGRLRQPTVCVLVDDVLTTGATLAVAEQVLGRGGHQVLGAFVLAATPPPDGAATRLGT